MNVYGVARLGAIQSFPPSESIQPLRLHFFLESFLSFFFRILYLTGIITFWFSWNAAELDGKWKASLNLLSLFRDLASYYSMVLAFHDLFFNVVVCMGLKNASCYHFAFLGFLLFQLLCIIFNLLCFQKMHLRWFPIWNKYNNGTIIKKTFKYRSEVK